MKTITLALLAAGFAVAIPFAGAEVTAASPAPATHAARVGGGSGHERSAHRRAALRRHIARRLHLNEGQIGQIKAIRGTTHSAVAAIRSNASLTPEQKHAQVHALRVAARKQMHAVLTPEQQAKLAEMRARMRERMGGL